MSKNILSRALCVLLFALCFSANAQQPKKIPRIGYLALGSPSADRANVEGFRKGLRELGYVEGKTIVIEYRYAEGKNDRLSDLAASWSGSKSMLLSQGVRQWLWLSKVQPLRSPLSLRAVQIRLPQGSSPALLDQEEILPG